VEVELRVAVVERVAVETEEPEAVGDALDVLTDEALHDQELRAIQARKSTRASC
jgi:hypothetical protein